MTVYIITVFFVLLLCGVAQYEDLIQNKVLSSRKIVHTREAKYFFALAALILVCVAGLRYRVGSDYGTYYEHYKDYAANLENAFWSLDEPGYCFVSWIAEKIYDDPATSIFLASVITIGLSLIVIFKNSDDLFFSGALFIFLGFWHGSFNGIRQYLAATVLFLGYRFLKEKNLILFLFVVFIAFLFHRSAIVMIILYFTVHRKVNVKNIIITIIVTLVLLRAYDRIFLFANWVMDTTFSLENSYTSTTVNILRVLATCSPMFLFLSFYMNQEKDKEEEFYLNLVIFHAVISIITRHSALLYRIGIYTTLFQTVAIPKLVKKFLVQERDFLKAIMILLYAVFWFYEIRISHSLNNFQWIWQR